MRLERISTLAAAVLFPALLAAPRFASAVECNGVEVPNDCESVEDQLADCDGNGVADLCDPENDCNRNGIADACDIESGAAEDENGNAIPDACETGIRSFHVTFREVEPAEGPDRAEVEVLLHGLGFAPGETGATGWALHMRARGCSIVRATVDGTIANPSHNFTTIWQHFCPFGTVSTNVGLSRDGSVFLDPAGSPPILRLTLEGLPEAAGGCQGCELGIIEIDPYCKCWHRGQPFLNGVRFGQDAEVVPTYTPLTVEVCVPAFHRGDSNGDGRIDISDPISTLNALFLEEAPLPDCLDAGDANNDERFDLSDAVFSLDYLFGVGVQPAPPAPGPPPEPCGGDPHSPGNAYLGCLSYSGC